MEANGKQSPKALQQPFDDQVQYTSLNSQYHSYPFSLYPSFSTMGFNELINNASEGEASSRDSQVLDSNADSLDSEDEVSLNDYLLHNGEAKKKIEILAAMVGIHTSEPAIVLTEVVRVLKHLKRINHF